MRGGVTVVGPAIWVVLIPPLGLSLSMLLFSPALVSFEVSRAARPRPAAS